MSFNLHLNPSNLAKFYREFYDLQEMEKPADDPSHYLTDGRMTMIISPWSITDFEGAGIEPRHMDHLGFRVEDVDSFKKDLQELVKRNPALAPKPGGHPIRYHRNLTACTHGAAGEPQGVTALVREGNAKCFHFAAQFRIFANSHARFKSDLEGFAVRLI